MASLLDLVAPDAADPTASGVQYAGREHDDYSTPPHWVDMARKALGGRIACDPASSKMCNLVVRAETYWTHDDSGLDPEHRWASPVYLNPPASRRPEFLERAANEAASGCEMVVCLNLKHLCTSYCVDTVMPHVTAIHIPRGRVPFTHPGVARSESPTDGCAFLYIGPNAKRFCAVFACDAGWTAAVDTVRTKPPRGQAEVL